MTILFNALLVLLLVFINGFFVAAEFAFVSIRRSRIETLATAGGNRARSATRLLAMLDNLNAYLSASQLGITLASLALGSIGEPFFSHLLEAPLTRLGISESAIHIIAYIVALGVITSLHIVLGEQAPKLMGLERAESVALACALPMQLFYKTFRLPVIALDWASARVMRLFGLNSAGEHGSVYTADELRQLVNVSHESGHIEADEKQLIERVFDFSDAEVREAMIPRTEVVALPVNASLTDAEQAFIDSGFSRLPVYREQLDEIVGVLFMKDLLPFLRANRTMQNGDSTFAHNSDALLSTHSNNSITTTANAHLELHYHQHLKPANDGLIHQAGGSSSSSGNSVSAVAMQAGTFNLEAILHAPMFVPATARLGKVLSDMQAAQTHLAFVVDEHGGIEGILTLEDLLEEIVGEINDEYDDEARSQVQQLDDETYLLDATLAVRDANRLLDLKLPEDTDYTTLAGFLLAQAGHMLQVGEVIEHDGATFTVESLEGRRIRRVRFILAKDSAIAAAVEAANIPQS